MHLYGTEEVRKRELLDSGCPLRLSSSASSALFGYIDGYNFYYSINKPATLRLGWCDFSKLAERFASRAFESRYVVGAVKYYTSK
ncbi:MAG: hypothetical protein WBW33_18335, partial [Bryobacteraceae bacterium]